MECIVGCCFCLKLNTDEVFCSCFNQLVNRNSRILLVSISDACAHALIPNFDTDHLIVSDGAHVWLDLVAQWCNQNIHQSCVYRDLAPLYHCAWWIWAFSLFALMCMKKKITLKNRLCAVSTVSSLRTPLSNSIFLNSIKFSLSPRIANNYSGISKIQWKKSNRRSAPN